MVGVKCSAVTFCVSPLATNPSLWITTRLKCIRTSLLHKNNGQKWKKASSRMAWLVVHFVLEAQLDSVNHAVCMCVVTFKLCFRVWWVSWSIFVLILSSVHVSIRLHLIWLVLKTWGVFLSNEMFFFFFLSCVKCLLTAVSHRVVPCTYVCMGIACITLMGAWSKASRPACIPLNCACAGHLSISGVFCSSLLASFSCSLLYII